MNLYKNAKRGGFKPKRAQIIQRMATQISNIRLPLRSYSVFDALLEQQKAQYGENFGMANPVPIEAMGQSLGAMADTPPSTQEYVSTVQRSRSATQADLARQSAGLADLIPSFGPGSARQINTQAGSMRGSQHGGIFGINQFNMTPGRAAMLGQQTRNAAGITQSAALPNMKLDALQPSLAQTLGSGMLSQAQLQNASWGNVRALLKPYGVGYTQEQGDRAAIVLQRMILEGYVRGVDVYRYFKEKGGLAYEVGSGGCGYSCGGVTGNGTRFVQMNRNGYASDIAFLNIFYQEVGHAMGMDHTRGLMAGSYQYSDMHGQTIQNYSKWLDWYFQDVRSGTLIPGTMKNYVGNPTRGLSATEVDNLIKQNPGWFPTVTGADPTGAPPGGGDTNNTTTNNTITNNNTFVPPTVNPGAGGQTFIGDSTVDGGRTQTGNTPVQGTPPGSEGGTDQPLRSFAAGLRDEKGARSATLQGLAGALARFKSG